MKITDLSFVSRGEHGTNWDVPPTDDYVAACTRGDEMAVEYMQYLRLNPGAKGSNVLGAIIGDARPEDNRGYLVGFLGTVERMTCEALMYRDPVQDLINTRALYARAEAEQDIALVA
ncbi:MAG: hypothetical protein RIG26_14950 [Thalassospira sp.]|uniref:hypothetical protein n=1 Tax=Thalassospira sp. TaxID=1912094 RepID=UPI0032F03E9A